MNRARLRISPAAVFSVGRDGVKIGLRGRSEGLVVSSGVFALIARFADPTPLEDALADAPDPREVRDVIHELVEAGVLVTGADPVGPDAAAQDHRAALTQLDDLQVMIQQLTGDLHAIGPHAPLATIGAALDRVRSDLLELQAGVDHATARLAERQLRALDRDAPLKLHLGSAGKRLEGWVNIDVHPAELCHNLARPLPFADRTVDFVYSAHTFEHLAFPDEAYRQLGELRRVLKATGVVRLVMPDLEALARAYVAGQTEVFAAISGRDELAVPPLEQLLAYAGAPVRTRDRWYDHKFGYDFTSLSAMLISVGFRPPKRCAYMASEHAALRLDDRSSGSTISIHGRSLSLFVEATV